MNAKMCDKNVNAVQMHGKNVTRFQSHKNTIRLQTCDIFVMHLRMHDTKHISGKVYMFTFIFSVIMWGMEWKQLFRRVSAMGEMTSVRLGAIRKLEHYLQACCRRCRDSAANMTHGWRPCE